MATSLRQDDSCEWYGGNNWQTWTLLPLKCNVSTWFNRKLFSSLWRWVEITQVPVEKVEKEGKWQEVRQWPTCSAVGHLMWNVGWTKFVIMLCPGSGRPGAVPPEVQWAVLAPADASMPAVHQPHLWRDQGLLCWSETVLETHTSTNTRLQQRQAPCEEPHAFVHAHTQQPSKCSFLQNPVVQCFVVPVQTTVIGFRRRNEGITRFIL